jgi:hypothetical protein
MQQLPRENLLQIRINNKHEKGDNMKLEINITKKRFYILAILFGLISMLGAVIAFNTNNPGQFGHSLGEIDFSQGINSILRITGQGNGIQFPDGTRQTTAPKDFQLSCKTYGYASYDENGRCPGANMLLLGHIGQHTHGLTCDEVVTRNGYGNIQVCNICCTTS